MAAPERWVGKSLERFEDAALLTGRARFMDDLDVVSGLDGRKNLLKLTPYEFEHLGK